MPDACRDSRVAQVAIVGRFLEYHDMTATLGHPNGGYHARNSAPDDGNIASDRFCICHRKDIF
jgi:hypothetical protein